MKLSFLGFVAVLALFLTQDVLFACAQGGQECTECGGKGWHECNYCMGTTESTCPYCGGSGGRYWSGGGACVFCYGKGLIMCYDCQGSGIVECSSCGGTGIAYTQPKSQPQQTEGTSLLGIAALALTIVATVGVAGLVLTRRKREKNRRPEPSTSQQL